MEDGPLIHFLTRWLMRRSIPMRGFLDCRSAFKTNLKGRSSVAARSFSIATTLIEERAVTYGRPVKQNL